ncbi:nuclear pore complex protein DDB_G0274915-like isoform X2 [Symsagittifera roscoffensis]|uniref:nuclear pore complex protein DDB_G0274915-like isoform X2 n=1 Tax=Symsagittifera roscoffensis TaxID=84072 RepID=UPI00307B1F04
MNSWLDRSWLNRNKSINSNSVNSLSSTSTRSSPYSIERQKYRYGISETPSMKLNRWSKSFGGISKIKPPQRNKSIFSDKSFLRSSIFEKQCSVKMMSPKRSLLSYTADMNRSKSSLEASARSTDRDVISSLRAFDSKPTKRNCAELNEIFDISSGNVKKRRKMNMPTIDDKEEEGEEKQINATESSAASNKSFWRDAALLASLSTSRQWLTEEMNKTVSASMDNHGFINPDGNNAATLSRCTTPDSVPGSDLSNSSTFQKSGLSNSIGGLDSRPPSLVNYALNHQVPYGTGQQSHSISSNSFITAPYYVQPIKVILREVSTNTDSDWNETSGSEKDTVRQFNRKDFERDQEFENERVRRLMGLDDEITAVTKVNKSLLGSTSSFKPAQTTETKTADDAPISSTVSFAAVFASSASNSNSATTTTGIQNTHNSQTMMSSVTGKIATGVPSFTSAPLIQNTAFGMSKDGGCSAVALPKPAESLPEAPKTNGTVSETANKPSINFSNQPVSAASEPAKSVTTSSSLFGSINFNSSVVPPKTSAVPSFNFGAKLTESTQQSSNMSSAAPSIPSFSFTPQFSTSASSLTGSGLSTFKFGAPNTDQSSPSTNSTTAASVKPASFAFSSPAVASSVAPNVSSAGPMANFKFSPSTNNNAVNTMSFGTFANPTGPKAEDQKSGNFSLTPSTQASASTGPSASSFTGSSLFGSNAPASLQPSSGSNMFGQLTKSTTGSLTLPGTAASGTNLFNHGVSTSVASTVSTASIFGSGSVTSATATPFQSNFSFSSTPSKSTAPATDGTVSNLFGAPSKPAATSAAPTAVIAPIFGAGFPAAASAQPAAGATAPFGGHSMFTGAFYSSSQSSATSMFKFGGLSTTASNTSGTFTFGGNNNHSSSQNAAPALFGAGGTANSTFGSFQQKTTQSSIATPFGGNSAAASNNSSQVSTMFGGVSSTTSASPGISNIFGGINGTSNAPVQTFGSQNIFGSNSASKSSAPSFGGSSATTTFPNTGSNPTSSLFGNSGASNTQTPVFGQSSLESISSGTAAPSAPSFTFGQGANSNQPAPAFNFGAANAGAMTFGGGSSNVATTQQPGMAATGPAAFSIGQTVANDSILPNRRIRTATRKTTKPGSKR